MPMIKDANKNNLAKNDLQIAVDLLKQGSLVAIPTETVYGLAGDAKNPEALAKIFRVKGRPKTNPLIIHIYHPDLMTEWAQNIPEEAYHLADTFWPGPLTLILQKHPSVPKIATADQNSVGLRVPNHPLTLELLRKFGGGLAAPSANRYQHLSPTTAQHVQDDLGINVDFILDGGPCTLGIESTIVSFIDKVPKILRLGAISELELQHALGQKIEVVKNAEIQVPGSDHHHYAPTKPLLLNREETFFDTLMHWLKKGKKLGILTCRTTFHAQIEVLNAQYKNELFWLQAPLNVTDYAKNLYARLRYLENLADIILVECPPEENAWAAILDRLNRASTTA